MKALIIGCGNIASMYDIKTSGYKTYAKSFSKIGISFDIYDPYNIKAKFVCEKYKVNCIDELNSSTLERYDSFVIASPTNTHFYYLKKFIPLTPKLIVCEKPVSLDINELDELESLYYEFESRIFVNYQRRFQPKLIDFKNKLNEKTKNKPIKNIVITYQNGIQNNASHALDFLSFLLNYPIKKISNIKFNNVYDYKGNDPTTSANFFWNDINLNLIGLSFIKFFHFNIDIYFEDEMISLQNGCNKIEFFEKGADKFLSKINSFIIQDCMNNSMLEISKHLQKMFYNKNLNDNFIDSIELSRYIAKFFIKNE